MLDANFWQDKNNSKNIIKEKKLYEGLLNTHKFSIEKLSDLDDLSELALEEENQTVQKEILQNIKDLRILVKKNEIKCFLSNEADSLDCYIEIHAGAGGTESQDWAEMLLRMYLRWAEGHGFKTEIMEVSDGDVAGIKGATIHIDGEHAFGWLRTETGVHRLVRKSPFDSGSRRHTSFASVFVAPELDDDIEIDLDMSDVRVDTYRASGAGGQHVNKTDSAIRLTHMPSGIVVQCQNQRSQHKNRDQAVKQLKAKLYEHEDQKRKAEMQVVEENKSDISWGSQIRSYVLDSARIKDLRTNIETSNTQAVLDGDLDQFIEASLKMGL